LLTADGGLVVYEKAAAFALFSWREVAQAFCAGCANK
jgi:hypothetical protein